MEFTNEQIQEKFSSLPNDLKEALSSAEVLKSLRDISEEHNLLLDKAAILEQEVSLILLGMVPSSQFVGRLKSELDISSKEANQMAAEINEKIFRAFRAALMQVHGEKALEFEKVEEAEEEKEEILDREELLREIERLNRGEVISNLDSEITSTSQNPAEEAAVIPNKLTEVYKSQKEVINIPTKSSKAIETAPKKTIDPYREPIE